MDSLSPGNMPTKRKRAIDELVRGRDLANQLQTILCKPLGLDGSSTPAKDLVEQIFRSLTDTLLILNCSESDEVLQIPTKARLSSPCSDARKSEESEESTKSSALKDRRGCYRRRKTTATWTKTTSALVDDGHAWRKYGQKVILNAKHPRNYYRCTHKYDQGCQATKQVQKTEDGPPMYLTTYNGQHTCKNLLKTPQIIMDSIPTDHQSFLLSFDSSSDFSTKQDLPFFSSFHPGSIKQEFREDIPGSSAAAAAAAATTTDLLTPHNQSSSSDHYLLSPDLTTFESSGQMTVLSSSDHGDVISGVNSCTASTHSLDMDMDMVVGSVDFDDVLQFEYF